MLSYGLSSNSTPGQSVHLQHDGPVIWFKCQWSTHLNVSLTNSDERFPGKINVFEPGPMKQL